jgi:hypothetical protein
MPDTSASLYEQLFPLTTVMKQRFVENFSGDALDTDRWLLTDSGTSAMVDAVDGGYGLKTNATTNNSAELTFNDIKPFDDSASVMIFVAQKLASAGGRYDIGLHDGIDATYIRNNTNDTKINVIVTDGSGTTQSNFSMNVENSVWRTMKIEMKASSVEASVDGTIEATVTTNLPNTGQLEPWLKCTHNNSVVAETRINYVECYNT